MISTAEAGQRLDRVVTDRLSGHSRASVQRWIADGQVTVDGRAARAKDLVVVGTEVTVVPAPPPPSDAEPDASVRVSILFEDEHLIVVDKPSGQPVHPGRGHATGTLVNGLLALPGFGRPPSDPRDSEGRMRPGIVHRLDKDTSGVLVVAKTERAREHLKAQLAARSARRVYVALTVGVPRAERIESTIGRDSSSRLRFTTRVARGRHAITNVEPVERLASGLAARIECRLETGRTHQIRVHLAECARTPILGDRLYGKAPADARLASIHQELGRQALHARELEFEHPRTGERVRFESALPEDLERALQRLRA